MFKFAVFLALFALAFAAPKPDPQLLVSPVSTYSALPVYTGAYHGGYSSVYRPVYRGYGGWGGVGYPYGYPYGAGYGGYGYY